MAASGAAIKRDDLRVNIAVRRVRMGGEEYRVIRPATRLNNGPLYSSPRGVRAVGGWRHLSMTARRTRSRSGSRTLTRRRRHPLCRTELPTSSEMISVPSPIRLPRSQVFRAARTSRRARLADCLASGDQSTSPGAAETGKSVAVPHTGHRKTLRPRYLRPGAPRAGPVTFGPWERTSS